MSRTLLAALALTATTLAAGGCGGSSKTAATSTTVSAPATSPHTTATIKLASGKPLTRGEWIAKGDAICAHRNGQLKTLVGGSTSEYIRALPQAGAYDRIAAQELSKLVPPPAMTRDWTEIVNDLRLYGEDASRVAQYMETKNATAGRPLLAEGKNLSHQLAILAAHDGFKQCSHQ